MKYIERIELNDDEKIHVEATIKLLEAISKDARTSDVLDTLTENVDFAKTIAEWLRQFSSATGINVVSLKF